MTMDASPNLEELRSSHISFLRGMLVTRAATPELGDVVMTETARFLLALFITRQVYACTRGAPRYVARASSARVAAAEIHYLCLGQVDGEAPARGVGIERIELRLKARAHRRDERKVVGVEERDPAAAERRERGRVAELLDQNDQVVDVEAEEVGRVGSPCLRPQVEKKGRRLRACARERDVHVGRHGETFHIAGPIFEDYT
jgi:hypothetical protein